MATRRLAIILSVDVVGYSRMMSLGAGELLAALNKVLRTIVKPEVEATDGRIIKLLGDGALIEFQSAFQALKCAVTIQNEMRTFSVSNYYAETVLLRIGLHAGDVMIEGEDVFGCIVPLSEIVTARFSACF